jgi:hypothetical protein
MKLALYPSMQFTDLVMIRNANAVFMAVSGVTGTAARGGAVRLAAIGTSRRLLLIDKTCH